MCWSGNVLARRYKMHQVRHKLRAFFCYSRRSTLCSSMITTIPSLIHIPAWSIQIRPLPIKNDQFPFAWPRSTNQINQYYERVSGTRGAPAGMYVSAICPFVLSWKQTGCSLADRVVPDPILVNKVIFIRNAIGLWCLQSLPCWHSALKGQEPRTVWGSLYGTVKCTRRVELEKTKRKEKQRLYRNGSGIYVPSW